MRLDAKIKKKAALLPLNKIDRMLEEIGHTRSVISSVRSDLRAIENQLFRVSSYKRTRQKRAYTASNSANAAA